MAETEAWLVESDGTVWPCTQVKARPFGRRSVIDRHGDPLVVSSARVRAADNIDVPWTPPKPQKRSEARAASFQALCDEADAWRGRERHD